MVSSIPVRTEPVSLTLEQQEYLLAKAAELERGARQEMKRRHGNLIGSLQRAASSPDLAVDTYLDAIELLDFEEQGKKESDFREWRDKRQDQFRDDAFGRYLQLQAQYILLTIEYMQCESDEDRLALIPEVLTYVGHVMARQPLDRRNVLKVSLDKSYLVRGHRIELDSVNRREWELVPGNTRDIYEAFVFPTIVRMRDAGLLEKTWNHRMNLERALARNTNELPEFTARREPELQWKRAEDFHALGNMEQGLLAMLKLLQSHAGHPMVLDWNREFQGYVRNADVRD